MVPQQLRGTYAGLAHESSINYFTKLGVTAVELLPVHHFIDEGHLVDKGLRDYWGYNTLGYSLPCLGTVRRPTRAVRFASSKRWSRLFTPRASK